MAIEVELFDGTVLEFPDGTPQDVILSSARRITAQKQQAAPKEEPGVLSQIAGTPKEFAKGVASGLVQAVGGLGALPYAAARYAAPSLKPFEETAFGKTITEAEKALAPGDEGYITQLAGGLGSFASMFGPQAVLRGVGTAGRLATGLAPKAATPIALGQTAGLGVEEARQRAAVSRAEGAEVTPGEELAALAVGVPIGLTELLPVERLFKGLDTGLSEGFKYTIANRVKRALQQGGIEGAQEVASGLMQDLSAKGIYNPNLEIGQSMFDELTVGGGVGAIAQTGLDILFKRRIQDAYNTTQRKKAEEEVLKRAEEARAAQEKQIATTKEQLGITEPKTLALPAPAEKVEKAEEVDLLQNPLGMFKPEQLEEGYVREVNKMRDQQGMAKVKSLSIEDIADAGAPQGEIDRLIAGRLSEQGVDVDKGLESKLTMADIENIAAQKNIDTNTQGFKDFLRRTTGTEGKLSPVQTLAAFESLSKLPTAPELQILPEGTNATRFTQEQYDKTVKSIKDMFPETGKLGRTQVIQEIKDYSGLENDRDAQSLLQAAIRQGDFDTVSTRNFLTLDKDGNQVGIAYPTRKSAERAAKARGLSVKERTSIDIVLPEAEKPLPGGPDIRRGEFKEGEAPAAYEIKSDQAVLATAKTEEEAAAKAERLQALRENKANGLLGQIKSIDSNIAKSQQKLESMEADGKADTLEYRQLSAKIAANNANLEAQKGRLNTQAQQYLAPVTVSPKGVKPVSRAGYTLFEKGKPKATFPTQQAAEEAALVGLETEQLQALVNLAPSQKGLQAKRLGKMARDELARRLGGEAPAGIKVKPTTTVKEAEEKLADLGIFTPKFKQQADELEKKLRPVLDKLGLKDLRLNIVRAIQTPMGEADGSYAEKLVTIALNADNPIRTLRHEAIHALKELGAFTDAQWKVLEKAAKENWLGKYGISQRYKGLTQSEQIEEAIADAFSDFDQTKPPAGLVGALFNKVKKFFEAMGNAMRGMGFQTAEDVFANVEKGVTLPGTEAVAGEEKFSRKVTTEEEKQAEKYFKENDILPYTPEKISSVPVETSKEKFSIKREGKYGDHDILGIPVNKNGTVTLYYPTDNETAREIIRTKKLIPAKGSNRIYLTNESSAPKVMGEPGNMDQPLGGANVLVQIDPALLNVDQEFDDGRKDFFIPLTEGQAFINKMKQTKLFTLEAARDKGFNTDRTLTDVGDAITESVTEFMEMPKKDRKERLKQAREVLKREHNIGTLLGENGKLEKTRVGDYGLTYEGQSVASLGLGLASAQRLNTQERLTTCPQSAICEGLCLGETSGQNLLYGGSGKFRSGPRLSQYLKTEALMMNPSDFGVLLANEIDTFMKWAKSNNYQTAIRLNVTSDIPPKVFKGVMDAFPDAMFYDYTKLASNVIAPNHHLTYSSTGASQVVSGEKVFNPYSNWDRMVQRMLGGQNVAMAFTSRTDMPSFVQDEKTGETFEVWNGDNYDARFLDPKTESGKGLVIGLTNKDKSKSPFVSAIKAESITEASPDKWKSIIDNISKQDEVAGDKSIQTVKNWLGSQKGEVTKKDLVEFADNAAVRNTGFFVEYDKARDGDTLVIKDQSSFKGKPKEAPVTITKRKEEKYSLTAKEISEGADAIAKMTPEVRGDTEYSEMPGGYRSHNLYEARRLVPTPSNKLKKVTERNTETLNQEAEFVLNVDGNHYYINLEEDPDNEDAFVYSFTPATDPFNTTVTTTFDVDELIKEIKGGKPTVRFSLKESIDPDTATAIDRTTTTRQNEGFVDRIIGSFSPEARARLRAGIINRYEGIERLTKKKAEEFGDQELLADQSAIAAALFSDRAAGVAASSFRNGVPVYEKGYTNVSDLGGTVKGLIPIFEPLMKYNDPYIFQMFQYYAGTKRGKRLDTEGREKLFTPDDIKRGQALEAQYPEFKQAFDEYQKYNQGLVKFMKDTGVISDKEAQVWTQNWDYIPFYRQMEGEDTAGPKVFSAISGVAKPKKLKGGEAPLADFMETVVRNSRAAIEAGMKNVASQRVARDVVAMGLGEEVSAKEAVGTDIMTYKDNGLTKHVRVADPLLVESVKGLNLPQLPFLDILSKPAEVLRNLVTKDPGFMLANLMRDSLQAWVTTGQNMTPIVDTFKQYGAALANMSPEARALAQAGLFTGYDFSGDVKATAREVEKELRKRSGTAKPMEIALWPVNKVWEALEKGSTASDVATRAEVYKRVLKETGNEAEAMYQAMEVLNFSRRGSSAAIRVLTAVVPFMNARIQGLDVLYRAGFGEMASRTREMQQKAFAVRSLYILGLSTLYWALASDSEEYKTAEPEARDNYWILGSVRVPIPFEIGTVFKVFPERILEYWFGQDTGKDLKDSIVRNVTSTLAFNPIPQAALPIIENVANYSFFTGQPIVGKGMEDVAPKFQATTGTSLLAQEVADATGFSPIKIDNLIRGYTGTLGTYAVLMIDSIMRGEGDPTKATMKAEQLPVIKRFFASEKGTGTVTSYYDLKNQVAEATRTINYLERTGNSEDLKAYYQEKGAKLMAIKPFIQAMDKDMTTLRELRQNVLRSNMDPDRKREVLDNIRQAEVNLTNRIQMIKKQIS